MGDFSTGILRDRPDAVAPDGSDVFLLERAAGGGSAVFRLPPGSVARAVWHPRVEEIWFVLSGEGRIWRRLGENAEETRLYRGVSLTIPVGTQFQFRCDGPVPLLVHGVTMPPWDGDQDAVAVAEPHWPPTL